jgi:hypothetical protein
MKRKRTLVLLLATGVAIVATNRYYAYDFVDEVAHLRQEANRRGLLNFVSTRSPETFAGISPSRLPFAGLHTQRQIARYRFGESDPQSLGRLVASAAPFYELIEDYAAKGLQNHEDWASEDYSAAVHSAKLLGMRALVDARAGEFQRAIDGVRLLHRFARQTAEDGLGSMASMQAVRWSNIVCAELSARFKSRADRAAIKALTAEQPTYNYKSDLAKQLSGFLLHLDAIEVDAINVSPPDSFGPITFNLDETDRSIGESRVAVLKEFIRGYDLWNSNELLGDALPTVDLTGLNAKEEFVTEARVQVSWLKRNEVEQLAKRRAIALTIAADEWHAKNGHWPTAATLAKQGLETVDPYTGKEFGLDFSDGRVHVTGLRTDRTRGLFKGPKILIETLP